MTNSNIETSLQQKLNPRRFTEMSGKMAAIVGFLVGEDFTDPAIREICKTSDGFILARHEGDIGCNDFIGSFRELSDNWNRLIQAVEDELTEAEIRYAKNLLTIRI